MIQRYISVGIAALTLGCATTKEKPVPPTLESRIKAEELFNPQDRFTELCNHFGGDYCQPDCAGLKAYLKEKGYKLQERK